MIGPNWIAMVVLAALFGFACLCAWAVVNRLEDFLGRHWRP